MPLHKIVCMHCGRQEDDHCVFEPSMPVGCVCPPGEWGEYVEDVCSEFVGAPGERCSRCEHDHECHREPNIELSGSQRLAKE